MRHHTQTLYFLIIIAAYAVLSIVALANNMPESTEAQGIDLLQEYMRRCKGKFSTGCHMHFYV